VLKIAWRASANDQGTPTASIISVSRTIVTAGASATLRRVEEEEAASIAADLRFVNAVAAEIEKTNRTS